jgi:hypothetical protein
MIQRLLAMKPAISAVLSEARAAIHAMLPTPEQWTVIEELEVILRPLAFATYQLSSELRVSLSNVLPVLDNLVNGHLAPKEDSNPRIAEVKTVLRNAISRRWTVGAESMQLMLATLLDPRFHGIHPFFGEDAWRDALRVLEHRVEGQAADDADEEPDSDVDEEVHEIAEDEEVDRGDVIASSSSARSPPPKVCRLDGDILLFGTRLVEREHGLSALRERELHDYLQEPREPIDTNPLVWWNQHTRRYPRIAKLAAEILGIPATSAASERVFSKGGVTVSRLRTSLKPSMVDALISLNMNAWCVGKK